MSRLILAGKELRVVSDQIGTPTYAPHLAEVLLRYASQIKSTEDHMHRLYNYSDSESISWYTFALRIRDYHEKTNHITPCTTEEYGARAPRPLNSRLDSTKLRAEIGFPEYPLSEGLQQSLGTLLA